MGIRRCLIEIIPTLFFDRIENKPTHINLCDLAERTFQKFPRVVISKTNEGEMGIFQSLHLKLVFKLWQKKKSFASVSYTLLASAHCNIFSKHRLEKKKKIIR